MEMKDNQITLLEGETKIPGAIPAVMETSLGRSNDSENRRVLYIVYIDEGSSLSFGSLHNRWAIPPIRSEDSIWIFSMNKYIEESVLVLQSCSLSMEFNAEAFFPQNSALNFVLNRRLENILNTVTSDISSDASIPPMILYVLSLHASRLSSSSNESAFDDIPSSFRHQELSNRLILHTFGIPPPFPAHHSAHITRLHLKWTLYEIGPTWASFALFIRSLTKLETLTIVDFTWEEIPTCPETINLPELKRLFLSLDTKLCQYILDRIITSQVIEVDLQCQEYSIKDSVIIPQHIPPISACEDFHLSLKANSVVFRTVVHTDRKQDISITLCFGGLKPGSQKYWFRYILKQWITSSFLQNAQRLSLFIERNIAESLSKDLWTDILSLIPNLRNLTFANGNLHEFDARSTQVALMQRLECKTVYMVHILPICPHLTQLRLEKALLNESLSRLFSDTLLGRINEGLPLNEVAFDVGIGASEEDLSSLSQMVHLSYKKLIEHDSVEDSNLHETEIPELELVDLNGPFL